MKYNSLYRNLVKVPVGVTFDEVRSYFNYIVNLANRIIDIYFANNIKLSEGDLHNDFWEVYNYYCKDGYYNYCCDDDDDFYFCDDFFDRLYFFENYVSYINNVNNKICDKVRAKEEEFEFLFSTYCPVEENFARDLFKHYKNDINEFLDEISDERENTPEIITIEKGKLFYLEIEKHLPMGFPLYPNRGLVDKSVCEDIVADFDNYFDIGEENIKKIEKDNFTYEENFLHSIEELMNRIIDIYIINDIGLPEENLLSDFSEAYNYYYNDFEDNDFDDDALICHWNGQFLEKENDYIHGIDISALKGKFCTHDLRFFYKEKIEDCITEVFEDRKQMGETPKEVETRIKQFI